MGLFLFPKMELKIHFYLYIKRGFWVVLLDFDLAVFIELENCEVCVCVCAFVWKSVCIRIISCLLFIPYVWYRTLACRFHFYSCLGLAEDAHWHDVIGLEGQWNILQVLIRCILLQTFFLQFSLPPITFASTKHKYPLKKNMKICISDPVLQIESPRFSFST